MRYTTFIPSSSWSLAQFKSLACITRRPNATCCMSTITHSARELLAQFRKSIPPLDGNSHKGQHGRIGIIGGSIDYIGAPYFAGMSALRGGADLVTIYCCEPASIPLKSLSPDIMVSPTLQIDPVQMKRIRSLVIGPGLGRNLDVIPHICGTLSNMLKHAIDIPLILDADALWWLANNVQFRDIVQNFSVSIITPNAPELSRFNDVSHFACIAKGASDVITVGCIRCVVTNEGSLKRVGGQGDILAGLTALFVSWAHSSNVIESREVRIASAAVAASAVTRFAANLAFQKRGRSLITSDILNEIGNAVAQLEQGSVLGV